MKTLEEIASILNDIYQLYFGGKQQARFIISLKRLTQLWNKKVIYDHDIDQLNELMLENHGKLIINLGDEIAVINERIVRNYREVPKKIINEYLNNDSQN
jgi:hypothetical protein